MEFIKPESVIGSEGSAICTRGHSSYMYSDDQIAGLSNFSFIDGTQLNSDDIKAFCEGKYPVPYFEKKLFPILWVQEKCLDEIKKKATTYVGQWQAMMEILVVNKAGAALFIHSPELSDPRTAIPSYVINVDIGTPQYDFPFIRCSEIGSSSTALVKETNSGTIFGLNISKIRVKFTLVEGPFEAQYNTIWWPLFFNVIFPAAFLYVAYLAALVLKRKKRNDAGIQGLLALTELGSNITCFLYFVYTGCFLRGSVEMAAFFVTNLSGLSFATTLLTAIFWHDLRVSATRMRVVRKSFYQRHKYLIWIVFSFNCLLDIISGVATMMQVPNFEKLVGGYNAGAQCFMMVVFYVEVRKATRMIDAQLKAALASTSKGNGSAQAKIQNTVKFVVASCGFMLLNVLSNGILGIGGGVWAPKGWFAYQFLNCLTRVGVSYTQIMVVFVPSPQKKVKAIEQSKASFEKSARAGSTNESSAVDSTIGSVGSSINSSLGNSTVSIKTEDKTVSQTEDETSSSSHLSK